MPLQYDISFSRAQKRKKRKERAIYVPVEWNSASRARARRSRGIRALNSACKKSRFPERRPMKPKRETSCRSVALSRSTSHEPGKSRSTFSAWFITLSIARSRELARTTHDELESPGTKVYRDRTLRRKKLGFFFARESQIEFASWRLLDA